MKKLIVGALAIYGGVKLGEKLLKKYREPIAEWVGKKAKKAVSDFMDDIFGIDNKAVKPEKQRFERIDYSRAKGDYSKEHGVVIVPASMSYTTVTNVTFGEADRILNILHRKLKIYGEVTTIDLENAAHYIDMPASCLGYGWTNLNDAGIRKLANGLYELELPRMKKL